MPTPKPTQISGARFLSERKFALLADEPRVGKLGTAVIAADDILAEKILVTTTASGRPVWRRGLPYWSAFPRDVQVLTEGVSLNPKIPSAIVAWGSLTNPKIRTELLRRDWDLVIGDEDQWAKNFDGKRTQAFYGTIHDDGRLLATKTAIFRTSPVVWALTGSPLPNSPFDMYPRMRALCPERLAADPSRGWPDVTKASDFKARYCITRPKKISNFRWIEIIIGGRNEEELNARLEGFMLLRTQADVGIKTPVFEILPLTVSDKVRRSVDGDLDAKKILEAAGKGVTKELEMHLGPLRRVTGEINARAVVDVVKEEFEGGLDKIVLMAWHRETMQILRDGLSSYGVVGIDGSTSAGKRGEIEQRFLNDPKIRVFIGQIVAAGEAIDLSSSANLIFVETSFTPKDMQQAAMRVTNHGQQRQPLVRVAALEGSIDEALQAILLRKWSTIRKVLTK